MQASSPTRSRSLTRLSPSSSLGSPRQSSSTLLRPRSRSVSRSDSPPSPLSKSKRTSPSKSMAPQLSLRIASSPSPLSPLSASPRPSPDRVAAYLMTGMVDEPFGIGHELTRRPLLTIVLHRMLKKGWTVEHVVGDVASSFDAQARRFIVNLRDVPRAMKMLAQAAREPTFNPQPFKTRATLAQKAAWLREWGLADTDVATEVEAALRAKAADLAEASFSRIGSRRLARRLGPSLLHDDAGLYMDPADCCALIVARLPNGEVEHVDLPTPMEECFDIPGEVYHLLETGRLHLNSEHRIDFDDGVLQLDPWMARRFAQEHEDAAENRLRQAEFQLLDEAIQPACDFTGADYEAGHQSQGTEKRLHRLVEHPDAVLLVQGPENLHTEGRLGRKEVEMEILALKRLAAMGYPVPDVERPVRIQDHQGELRWGLVEKYFEGAVNSKYGSHPNMNELTIEAALSMKAKLQADDLKVADLQFLVCADGDLVLIDPKGFAKGQDPANGRSLDLLIEFAKESIRRRLRDV